MTHPDHVGDRLLFAVLACMAGIGLCLYVDGQRGEPRWQESGTLGKTLCLEIQQVLTTAPPEFRPPLDAIRSMVDRCLESSQEELSEEG